MIFTELTTVSPINWHNPNVLRTQGEILVMKKVALVTYNPEMMCFAHVLLYSIDFISSDSKGVGFPWSAGICGGFF